MKINFKRIVNPIKTRFFKLLTSSFKNSKGVDLLPTIHKKKISRVLITRPNHRLGNQLLLSPLIQTIESEFPYSKIDLLINGNLSSIIYKNYTNIGKIYSLPKKPFKNLSLYLNVSYQIISSKYDIAVVGDENSNSSKIFTKLSRAKFKIFCSEKNTKANVHIAKKPIDNLNSILHKENNNVHYPKLDIKLSNEEIKLGHEILSKFFAEENHHTIAIFTNATGNKKLSKQWWNEFCSKIEKSFPNAHILEILPKENISQVDFKYKSYLSSDLREIAAVIENCSLFIGADSGIMHLATSTNTPTFGLFNGATKPEIYGPFGHFKYVFETNKSDIEDLVEMMENIFFNQKTTN